MERNNMNKELQDFGKMTEPWTEEIPNYKFKELLDYCNQNNKKPIELTDREGKKFIIK